MAGVVRPWEGQEGPGVVVQVLGKSGLGTGLQVSPVSPGEVGRDTQGREES